MKTMKFGDYARKLFEEVDFDPEEIGDQGEGPKEDEDELKDTRDADETGDGVDIDADDFGDVEKAKDIELDEDDDELKGVTVGGSEDIDPSKLNAASKAELTEAMRWWKSKSLKEQEKVAFRLFKAKKKKILNGSKKPMR